MEDRQIDIATITDSDKASMIVAKLENEGIWCTIREEIGPDAFSGGKETTAELKLVIHLKDLQQAADILFLNLDDGDVIVEPKAEEYFDRLADRQFEHIEYDPGEKEYRDQSRKEDELNVKRQRYLFYFVLGLILFVVLYSLIFASK
ncbi:MAG: hypothetical protein JW861_08675 [Bacteroidales bacterium]|nr:hypothetical protein [Bacteroidales bacterium]